MSKQFLAILAAIVLLFVGIMVVSGGDKTDDKSGGSSKSAQLTQHIKGNGSSGVTLVEYGDYQCPYCYDFEPTLKAIQEKYNEEVKFQFRNFPIQSAHQNAFAAARAAEAADAQGKFWEMHDALYSPANWPRWKDAQNPNEFFNEYAAQLGLDVEKFKTDFASKRVNDLINADLNEGTRLGVTGTPAFFLDGKKIEIANSQDAFEKVLDEAIAKKKAAQKSDERTQ